MGRGVRNRLLFPAIDVVRSGTSRDEALVGHKDAMVTDEFRRHALHADPVEVLGYLMELSEKTGGADKMVDALSTSEATFRQGS